jgi:hypothetical protein
MIGVECYLLSVAFFIVMLNVIKLSVVMLSVVMLIVAMLSVVVPLEMHQNKSDIHFDSSQTVKTHCKNAL